MYHVDFIFSDSNQRDKFLNSLLKISCTINLFDMNTSDRNKGFKIKSSYGARKDPFLLLSYDDKPIEAFYSDEESKDNALIQFFKKYKL